METPQMNSIEPGSGLPFVQIRDSNNRIQALVLSFAGDKPLILSEFGMDTIRHPESEQAHLLAEHVTTVFESGLGFGFLALIISYLPVIYQAFSRREVSIVLLDARAGSPPTASELLQRHNGPHGLEALHVHGNPYGPELAADFAGA